MNVICWRITIYWALGHGTGDWKHVCALRKSLFYYSIVSNASVFFGCCALFLSRLSGINANPLYSYNPCLYISLSMLSSADILGRTKGYKHIRVLQRKWPTHLPFPFCILSPRFALQSSSPLPLTCRTKVARRSCLHREDVLSGAVIQIFHFITCWWALTGEWILNVVIFFNIGRACNRSVQNGGSTWTPFLCTASPGRRHCPWKLSLAGLEANIWKLQVSWL